MARLILAVLLFASAMPWAEATAPTPPAGASSCSGCHTASKSVDTPVPRLVGRSPAEIEAAMLAFRTGQKPTSVMDRIAKGFSDDEITAIAVWYAAQKDEAGAR
jgi:cytochrome subunit of sulfide dehydrogenase